jgi:hypothetical protein
MTHRCRRSGDDVAQRQPLGALAVRRDRAGTGRTAREDASLLDQVSDLREPSVTESKTARERITDELASWPGVKAGAGRRGEFAFKVGRREIGHLHGDDAAHFFFPKQVWADLLKQGRVVHPRSSPESRGRPRAESRMRPTSAT